MVVLAAAVVACSSGGDSTAGLSPLGIEGRDIARDSGCAACHGRDGGGGVGPAWKGLAGTEVELDDGTTVVADADYLTSSIMDPGAQQVAGYTVTMPANDLDEAQVAAVVAYITDLGAP